MGRKPASAPNVIVLAGPNGAGKSTCAPELLRDTFHLTEFVNADVIAQGLSGFDPQGAALAAGRELLERVRELARQHVDFAFETTLASRSYAPWLADLIAGGYAIRLVFLWLPSADLAVERVALRVVAGGHDVPETTVRRRYAAGLRNFGELYQPLASIWHVYDSSSSALPRLIATGVRRRTRRVYDQAIWRRVRKSIP